MKEQVFLLPFKGSVVPKHKTTSVVYSDNVETLSGNKETKLGKDQVVVLYTKSKGYRLYCEEHLPSLVLNRLTMDKSGKLKKFQNVFEIIFADPHTKFLLHAMIIEGKVYLLDSCDLLPEFLDSPVRFDKNELLKKMKIKEDSIKIIMNNSIVPWNNYDIKAIERAGIPCTLSIGGNEVSLIDKDLKSEVVGRTKNNRISMFQISKPGEPTYFLLVKKKKSMKKPYKKTITDMEEAVRTMMKFYFRVPKELMEDYFDVFAEALEQRKRMKEINGKKIPNGKGSDKYNKKATMTLGEKFDFKSL